MRNEERFRNLSRSHGVPPFGFLMHVFEDLNFIGKAWYTEIKTSFKLYEEVITRIWNNENLYGLIHKLLYYKISRSSDCHFSAEQIMSILNINRRIMEGLNLMEKKELDMNKNAKSAGYYLKESYVSKGAKDKISGLCYKILNGLKLRNRNTVMNIIFNMYLYVGSPVPKIIAEMLNDSNSLEQYGYAFVAGLLSDNYNKKENEEEHEENRETQRERERIGERERGGWMGGGEAKERQSRY